MKGMQILVNQTADKNGRLLLIEAVVDDVKFVFINIYNCNTELRQLLTLTKLHKILQNVEDIGNKKINIRGRLAKKRNPTLKKKCLRKMIELIKGFELCDIWRIQNPTEKRFTFRENHIS